MHRGATKSGAWQETLPAPDWKGGLIGRIAKSDSFLDVVLHHGFAHRKPQLIMDCRRLEVGHRFPDRSALEPNHFQSLGRQFLGHDCAGQANAYRNDIDGLQTLHHLDQLLI